MIEKKTNFGKLIEILLQYNEKLVFNLQDMIIVAGLEKVIVSPVGIPLSKDFEFMTLSKKFKLFLEI